MRVATCWGLVLLLGCGSAPPKPASRRADVERLAEPLFAGEHATGLGIALVTGDGAEVYGLGKARPGEPVDERTTFEIGSMTKVFTALALQLAIAQGEVTADTTIDALLPCPAPAVKLVDLASHTSGWPRMPPDFAPSNPLDPYADYDEAKLCATMALLLAQPQKAPGEYAYSNLGAGALGHALARKAGVPYVELVRARIAGRLGLDSVSGRDPTSQGHDIDGQPVGPWHDAALGGAGVLRANTADMASFVRLNLRPPPNDLGEAMRAMHAPRAERKKGRVGLGWQVGFQEDPELRWHDGGTYGTSSFMGFDAAAGVGVVVLANQYSPHISSLAMALLDMQRGRPHPVDVPPPVAVDEATLQSHVGDYTFTAEGQTYVMSITRDGPRLFAQITGQPAFRIYPESPTRFRYRIVDAALVFEPGALVQHQNGMENRWTRK